MLFLQSPSSRHIPHLIWGGVPYSLAVTCDGEDVYFGPTVSTNPYGTYNWACAPLGEQNYCAAM